MVHRSHTQLSRQTRRIPEHAVGTKGGRAFRAIPRPLGSARLGSRKRIKLVRSTRGPERPPLGSMHLISPVEHCFERHGADPLFLAFVTRLFSMNPYGTDRSGFLTQSSNASGSTSSTIRATFPPWQYLRKIAFMSTSATRHQNSRFEFETVKNARADSPAPTDAPPARVGFSKSRTADTITAAPRRR
jgi:hypothetical protein